jgi:hypothetical protein
VPTARPTAEGPGGLVEEPDFATLDLFKIHRAAVCAPAGNALGRDPAPLGEEFETNQEGIAGKGRGARIGRVAITGGTERQHLPDVLPGGGQEFKKLVCGGAEIADASTGGQRADVEQNSGRTLELHIFIIAGIGQTIIHSRLGGYNPSVW